jgi:hypothetical protein
LSAALDRLRVVAHFPGRLRVRADTFRVLPEVTREVVRAMSDEPGVSSVTASEATGSILILYDPRLTQLLRLLHNLIQISGVHGVDVDERDFAATRRPGDRVRQAMGDADERVRQAAGGNVDLRVGVPGGLALLGLGKLFLGKVALPQWYDLLFWSFVTFSNLNPAARAGETSPHAGPRGPRPAVDDEK